MSEKQFEGRTAIVTGGTRGIGKAIALELARRGSNVAFNFSKSADGAVTDNMIEPRQQEPPHVIGQGREA